MTTLVQKAIPHLLAGVSITLAGKSWVLPPCSLATLQRHGEALDDFAKAGSQSTPSAKAAQLVVDVVSESLRRNYPDVTAEFVAEHVGIDEMTPLLHAAMDASGLLRKTQPGTTSAAAGEGGTLGESTGTALPPTS